MTALKAIGTLALFAASLTLVIIGQMHDGPLWLGAMLLGLAGLLVLLWLYNRRYTKADRIAKAREKQQEAAAKMQKP